MVEGVFYNILLLFTGVFWAWIACKIIIQNGYGACRFWWWVQIFILAVSVLIHEKKF